MQGTHVIFIDNQRKKEKQREKGTRPKPPHKNIAIPNLYRTIFPPGKKKKEVIVIVIVIEMKCVLCGLSSVREKYSKSLRDKILEIYLIFFVDQY
jgi:hypothetical protein